MQMNEAQRKSIERRVIRSNGKVNTRAVADLMGQLIVPVYHLVKSVVYQVSLGEAPRKTGARSWDAMCLGDPAFVRAHAAVGALRCGWVCGLTFLQTGHRQFIGHEEGYSFVETGPRTPALQVKYWPTVRPVLVPVPTWGWTWPAEEQVPISPAMHAWRLMSERDQETARQWTRHDFHGAPEPGQMPSGDGKG